MKAHLRFYLAQKGVPIGGEEYLHPLDKGGCLPLARIEGMKKDLKGKLALPEGGLPTKRGGYSVEVILVPAEQSADQSSPLYPIHDAYASYARYLGKSGLVPKMYGG